MSGARVGSLLGVDDSVVCIIDVQPGFLDKLGLGPEREPFVQRVVWIAALARALTVPIVVTEEEPDRNGPTLPEVLAQIPEAAPRHTKPTFGLADVPEILMSVEGTGRRTTVLVGMETDVCVAHSALGLLDRGYRVAVVRDAVASPGAAHNDGIERMRAAGVVVVGTKGLFYEWVRTAHGAWAMDEAMSGVLLPDGLTL